MIEEITKKKEFYFLTREEASFFKALLQLVIPSGEDPKQEPGGREVGSINYIDSTLVDFPPPVQSYFRSCISLVNSLSDKKFGLPFSGLNETLKNSIIRELFGDPMTREQIFDLRSIVLESFY